MSLSAPVSRSLRVLLWAFHIVLAASQPAEPLGPSTRRTDLVISEIHYKPAERKDKRALEFVELYNSGLFPLELGGYRLEGVVEFTFPNPTTLDPDGFLVLAREPIDVQAVYQLPKVLGWPKTLTVTNITGTRTNLVTQTQTLPGTGELRIVNPLGAKLLSVTYSDQAPWPAAPDGSGHSLVLARPSLGENDPSAWEASALKGGSPGRREPAIPNGYPQIVINEFLAHATDTNNTWIELQNLSTTPANLTGVFLSDSFSKLKYQFPPGTTLPGRGRLLVRNSDIGTLLDPMGGILVVTDAADTRVLDAIRYGPQPQDVSHGRWPDGADAWFDLDTPTPGRSNSRPRLGPIVITEILAAPIRKPGKELLASDDEFVELYNRSETPVNLTDWTLGGDITFRFPAATILPPNRYLTVARSATQVFLSSGKTVTCTNLTGNYVGKLGDTDGDVWVARPEVIRSFKKSGVIETNHVQIAVDHVHYHTGPATDWAHQGGASLELVDVRSPGISGLSQWRPSEATRSNAWDNFNLNGILTNTWGTVDRLEFFLPAAGECLLDTVRIRSRPATGGAFRDHTINGTFEDSATGWWGAGNHGDSQWEADEGFLSPHSLRIRASGPGDSVAHHVFYQFDPPLATNSRFVVTGRAKWLRGAPILGTRLANSPYATELILKVVHPGGTPGQPNSTASTPAGPTVTYVGHDPLLPQVGQPLTVQATLQDVAEIGAAIVRYRFPPAAAEFSTPLTDDGLNGDRVAGDGIYSGQIPSQAAGTLVAYRIVASGEGIPATESVFPRDGQELLVRFGETPNPTALDTLRLWTTTDGVETQNSDTAFSASVIYRDHRWIPHATARWSPPPSTNGNSVRPGRLLLSLPRDSGLLGTTEWALWIAADDPTLLRSSTAQWMAAAAGLPSTHIRPTRLMINGANIGVLAESYQPVDEDFLDEWFRDRDHGDLFELTGMSESTNGVAAAQLRRAFTLIQPPEGDIESQRAFYRSIAPLRRGESDRWAYDRLQTLTAAAHAPTNRLFRSPFPSAIQEDAWRRWIAFRHALGDTQSFGCRESRAGFAYKPETRDWLLLADPTVPVLTAPLAAGPTGDDLFELHPDDDGLARFLKQPENRRAYQQSLFEIAQQAFSPAQLQPWLKQRSTRLRAAGVEVGSTTALEDWIARRQTYLLGTTGSTSSSFRVLTASGLVLETNLFKITGLAPPTMEALQINGRNLPIQWGTDLGWTVTLLLNPGTNSLKIQALDRLGIPLANGTANLGVTFAKPAVAAAGAVVINEINYNPFPGGTAFIELYNRSPSTGFDMSGWLMKGVDFTFPNGAYIAPGGYLVIAGNAAQFTARFGSRVPLAGEFPGTLANNGEVLKLVIPGISSSKDTLVDKIAYGSAAPWPEGANGHGASLQLLDPAQDHNSPYNWSDGSSNLPPSFASGTYPPTPGRPNLSVHISTEVNQPPITNTTPVAIHIPEIPRLRINEVQAQNNANITNRFGETAPWIELYNFGFDEIRLGGMSLSTNANGLAGWIFPDGATVGARKNILIWADGRPERTGEGEYHASFILAPTNGLVVLSWPAAGRLSVLDSLRYHNLSPGQSFGGATDGEAVDRVVIDKPQPGVPNQIPIRVVINEWMTANSTFLRDEADGHYDDWFELYNASPIEVDLSGYYLSDTLTNRTKWRIPDGVTLRGKGHRVIWADDEPGQTRVDGELHAGFSLARSGEALALYAPDQALVDSITLFDLANNQSAGRYPDGSASLRIFEQATPAAMNDIPPPVPPPAEQPCLVGGDTIAAQLSLWGAPNDVLSFWLEPGAPPGVTVDRVTGELRWAVPQELPPGHYEFHITVCDIRPGATPLDAPVTLEIQPQLQAVDLLPLTDDLQQLVWIGPTCHAARVQYRNSLHSGTWTTLPGVLKSHLGLNQVVLPKADPTGFYRLIYE